MELRYLRSFLAIADELHFGRAAARLHLSQPSLSQHLQRLERAVGVELVRRTSHEVALTAAGRAFRAEALALLEQADRAVRAARDADAGRVGTLRVGFNFPAGQHVLQPTLRHLHADLPGVTVELREARSGPQLAALDNGQLDVAMVFGTPADRRRRSRRVLTLPLVAVVGSEHPWASRPHAPFRDLADEPCVLFRRASSPAMHDTLLASARSVGIGLSVAAEVDDPGATAVVLTTKPVVGFASATRAATVAPTTLAAVPLVDPVPTVSVSVVWRPDASAVVDAFLSSLDAAAPFGSG